VTNVLAYHISWYGVADTGIAIHGPATSSEVGEKILEIPYEAFGRAAWEDFGFPCFDSGPSPCPLYPFQPPNATDGEINVTDEQRELLLKGLCYLIIRSAAYPDGAIRGQILVPWIGNDFDRDGRADIFWQNTRTGARAVWFTKSITNRTWALLTNMPAQWRIAALGDFNADSYTDLALENTSTGERVLELLRGTNFNERISLGAIRLDWRIAAAPDMNSDGRADLLWQNVSTGGRYLWLMNSTNGASGMALPSVPIEWNLAAAGNFGGLSNILWQNRGTGDYVFWQTIHGRLYQTVWLGRSIDWRIGGAGDFNGDGVRDILWQHRTDGRCTIRLSSGNYLHLPTVSPDWQMQN
jgi:hypothetical protein